MTFGTKETSLPLKRFLLAGLFGGLAEMLSVMLYGALSPTSSADVARQVTATVFPAAEYLPLAPQMGIAIHLSLSLALGVAFGTVMWAPFAKDRGTAIAVASAVSTLVAVWAVNFFVVLPNLNPGFVLMMPYGVTLTSKALFGVVMAWVLQAGRTRCIPGDAPLLLKLYPHETRV